ncbi:hypothetical protein NEISICOT_02162 [Neisseria sicca ATCC 29256]|uniref:Uncharacterized protein n=1 Tax=Neisseria sicca ATCC 29256 TaxID=547045 RepID=C6M6L0_NEISI|nr:hypothetical protein NEISICOT_02162 [Neisseria sicca ATCC 29256]
MDINLTLFVIVFVWVIQMKIWQVRSRAVQFCFQGLGIFNGLFVN